MTSASIATLTILPMAAGCVQADATTHAAPYVVHGGQMGSAEHSHSGLVPPQNPTSNYSVDPKLEAACELQPPAIDNSDACVANSLAAIDGARADEGVAPLSFDIARFESMSASEQLFVIANLERIDRGLQPVLYLTTQLNQYAQTGASTSNDPDFPSDLTGGADLTLGTSNWAGGYDNVLWADEGWMYDDGWGGSAAQTPNGDCTSATATGCWGHRDDILLANPANGCYLAMGAAASVSESEMSYAELFIDACGPIPSDQVLTWSDAESALAGSGTFAVANQDLVDPSSFSTRYSDWLEVQNGDGVVSWSISSGSLPPGYTLTSTGHLTGPLSEPDPIYRFSVSANDPASSQSASAPFSLKFPASSTPVTSGGTRPSAPAIRDISKSRGTLTIVLEGIILNGGRPLTGYQYSFNRHLWITVAQRSNATFLISHLTAGKTYRVFLRALNAVGAGAPSRGVSVRVL